MSLTPNPQDAMVCGALFSFRAVTGRGGRLGRAATFVFWDLMLSSCLMKTYMVPGHQRDTGSGEPSQSESTSMQTLPRTGLELQLENVQKNYKISRNFFLG